MSESEYVPPGVDPSRPSPARLYDYYLGGTHNLPVDRALGDELKAAVPDLLDGVLAAPELRALIDLAQPVGLLMTAVLHFVADGSDPWRLVARYVDACAPGSYLVLSHFTADNVPPRAVRASQDIYEQATESIYPRSRAEVSRFFDGLELVAPQPGAEPALTFVGIWGAEDPAAADSDGARGMYCGVGRRR